MATASSTRRRCRPASRSCTRAWTRRETPTWTRWISGESPPILIGRGGILAANACGCGSVAVATMVNAPDNHGGVLDRANFAAALVRTTHHEDVVAPFSHPARFGYRTKRASPASSFCQPSGPTAACVSAWPCDEQVLWNERPLAASILPNVLSRGSTGGCHAAPCPLARKPHSPLGRRDQLPVLQLAGARAPGLGGSPRPCKAGQCFSFSFSYE